MSGKSFAGRVVLVTGGGRGIGLNIARAFALAGARTVICDLDAARGDEAVSGIAEGGGQAQFIAADLSQAGAAARLVETVLAAHGRLDVLVNNARARGRANMAEETEDGWDAAMAVNLRAPFFLAQAALPRMTEGGSIINICSVSSLLVSLESPAYQASKAGLMHLTRYLAVAAGARKIRCNAILPGFIVQDEHRPRYDADDNAAYRAAAEAIHPLKTVPGKSDDVARAALFLAGEDASFITGQALVIDGGLTIQDPWAAMNSPGAKI